VAFFLANVDCNFLASTCILLVISMQACVAFGYHMQVSMASWSSRCKSTWLAIPCTVQVNLVCWSLQCKTTWFVDHHSPSQHGLQILYAKVNMLCCHCSARQHGCWPSQSKSTWPISSHVCATRMTTCCEEEKKVTRTMHLLADAWWIWTYLSVSISVSIYLSLHLWWVNIYRHINK